MNKILLEQLITPLLLDKISAVKISQLHQNNHYELILIASKSLLLILNGKKRIINNSLSTIIAKQALLKNHTIKLVISEF